MRGKERSKMGNFLQIQRYQKISSGVCFLVLLNFTALYAQTEVLGKDFSIVADPIPVTDNQLLSFESMSYFNSIECKWSGHFSGTTTSFELQRATDPEKFVTLGVVKTSQSCGSNNTYCFEDKTVQQKVPYFYRIKYSTNEQSTVYSTVISAKANVKGIVMAEAFPNPYKERTTIQYILSNPSLVTLEISNEAGEVVKRFQQGLQEAGRYAVPFSAKESGLPTGKYVVTVWFDNENYQLVITESE